MSHWKDKNIIGCDSEFERVFCENCMNEDHPDRCESFREDTGAKIIAIREKYPRIWSVQISEGCLPQDPELFYTEEEMRAAAADMLAGKGMTQEEYEKGYTYGEWEIRCF